jgi:cobalt/nickel transport system permease protein
MHIPDGYLSPATCVTMYGASAPFWYAALARMKRTLHTQTAPLLAVFSALSFIVMMFNLPLPGGTTGHAVGVATAAIVLGPWGAILSISMALVIQALLFGDGGITAIGANCFNMAIAGALVAYAVYRLISGRAAIGAHRRVIAAGAAGYIAINVSALLAAIEFGLQPMLFHDAIGAPLYAPYPLHIAIPAMMIGHLTIAGLAETVLAAGVVAYLQKADPELLEATAPAATRSCAAPLGVTEPGATWRRTRPLWISLGVLLALTPVGIVAAGSAWGEWSPADFSNQAARRQIARASGSVELPAAVPHGLRRLADVWTSPMPRYSAPFLRSAAFGYLLSAMTGAGLIILAWVFFSWLQRRARDGAGGVP